MDYVTIVQCEKYRDGLECKLNNNCVEAAKNNSDLAFIKKFMWVILGALIGGYVSIIFTITNYVAVV